MNSPEELPEKLPEKNLVELLRAGKWKVGFAESCTGGLVSARLAALAGVSDVYMGSVVAYSNEIKVRLLGVSESLIQQVGAVSTPVATAMAKGARRQLQVAWAGSITGVAGPSGGTAQKPVGTVCFAVSGPTVEWAKNLRFDGSREQIQDQSAQTLLRMLGAALRDGESGLINEFGPSADV